MRSPPLILIADDNATNLDILQTRLATQGYEIMCAADGEQALELALRHKPDLLLLDIMMPKLDGLEVCRRIKSDASLPFMPIIMITARANSADVVAGLEAGADEYLTKPVDQASLVGRVKSMLRIKALQDTVQQQAQRLEAQSAELATWNQALQERVAQRHRATLAAPALPLAADRRDDRVEPPGPRAAPPRDHRMLLRPARLDRFL